MVGWHHRLNGHRFGLTPGVGDGQGSLVCCTPWDCKVGYNCSTELTDWLVDMFYRHVIKNLLILILPFSFAIMKPINSFLQVSNSVRDP